MAENVQNDGFDLGATDAPENKERVHLKPGFHKLKVESFTYTKEEDGKTPNIIMKLTKKDADGNDVELTENLYMSGKLNTKGHMSSVIRLQELYKGLTGDPKMTIQPSKYTYRKKEQNGSFTSYIIPNPAEICAYLIKKLVGKHSIFKVGGEINDDGNIFARLSYSQFLYYTDKGGNLCKYKEERDFTEAEYKYNVQKRKGGETAPTHSSGLANTAMLDAI